MTTRENRVVVAADAAQLAALLAANDMKPLWPTTSRGAVVTAYSAATREEVRRRLQEAGFAGDELSRRMDALSRRGVEVEPAAEAAAYEDPRRDEGLRVALAAGAEIYLTADEGLLELGEWKGILIVGDAEEVRRHLLAREETAVAFRAANEQEAHAVAGVLAAEGIEARVVGQQVPWYDGVLIMGQGYWGNVVVFEKDLEKAQEIIAAIGD